jgi:hypothetical protein
MEENELSMARAQVVEAMENGLPWHEAASRAGLQISQSTAYRLRQRMRKAANKRCAKAGMDTQPNCEARSAPFWKKPVGKLPKSQATRSKRSLPSGLLFLSV